MNISTFRTGAFFTIIALIGIIADLIIGTITGGNLTALPQTAVGRFEQLQQNCWLGLYNLDLLNVIIQLLIIPGYIALFTVHRKSYYGAAMLAFVLYLIGTGVFIMTNVALPMLELSMKYATTTIESQKVLYAAAGEALLARGVHGSMGAFMAFILPSIAGVIMSFVMLKGRVFSKTTSILGISGGIILIFYLVLVTFVPETKTMATAIAAPGGLMFLAWMILFTKQLFKLGKINNLP